jgi:methionine-rich copper-binding protein CopC
MARALRHFPLLVVCGLAAVAALPGSGRAHAVVTRAALRDATIAADTPTATTLEFNSSIEAKLAKVTLVDDHGAERSLDLAPGEHPSNVLVVALPALSAGRYALKYKLLAADGHVTESVLRFQVGAPK